MNDTVAAVVLLLLVGLRILLIGAAAWLFIPKRRDCPHCSSRTLALVSPRWMGVLLVQRRWCTCGWSGWSKYIRWTPPGDASAPDASPASSGGSAREFPAPSDHHSIPVLRDDA